MNRPPAKSATTPMAVEIWLYVLELEGGHFYVGQSSNPDARINAHKAGKASSWTTLHPYFKEVIRQPTGTTDWKVAEALENKWTLELMQLRGWEKVRGGFWCHRCPIQTRKGLIAHGKWEVLGLPPPSATPAETTENEAPTVKIAAPPTIVFTRRRRRLIPESPA